MQEVAFVQSITIPLKFPPNQLDLLSVYLMVVDLACEAMAVSKLYKLSLSFLAGIVTRYCPQFSFTECDDTLPTITLASTDCVDALPTQLMVLLY